MNTPTVWCVGPHQYKLSIIEDLHHDPTLRRIIVEYNLYGNNGVTVTPRPGVPNAHGWKVSRRTFPATVEGRRDATLHADSLLRPQDRDND